MKNRANAVTRLLALLGVAVISGTSMLALPRLTPQAAADENDSVYINEPLQDDTSNWELEGAGAPPSSQDSATGWVPQLMNVWWANNNVAHSEKSNGCTNANWPQCQAGFSADRDSNWLTLTTDNTNAGKGAAGTALYNEDPIPSDLGVVLEYDQRLYRTNNGQPGGSPVTQGGGDGIAVYLADANPPNYGNPDIITDPTLPGGYGAGLGYSSVSNTGDGWCPAQPGVAGGYFGIGFDVYGNYQKAETYQDFGTWHRATRPDFVSGNSPQALNQRLPQSIGLRGSGIRFDNPNCDPISGSAGLGKPYGEYEVPGAPLVTNPGYVTIFQPKWNAADSANLYKGQYEPQQGSGWTYIDGEDATNLPSGFDNPNGYVQFLVPDSAAPFMFIYENQNSGGGWPGGNVDYGPIAQDSSLGSPPNSTPLTEGSSSLSGGYKWLAGTGNLSNQPNPGPGANDNAAAVSGALLDNEYGQASHYHRVRVTLTPKPNGDREIVVYMSDKLQTADDVCVSDEGKLIENVSTSGGTDECLDAEGTWRYNGVPELTEQFRYDLGASAGQAAMPDEFRLGFSASTGWAVNYHQVRNLRVRSVVDLEVQKKVSFIGEETEIPENIDWEDEDTGTAGENIAYKVTAWNNGPDSLSKDFPAHLTDGLGVVPFEDTSAVTWTAKATDGAEICTEWDTQNRKCDIWGTELTGTGPITDAGSEQPLRWYAPSRTAPGAGSSAVTVEFVGEVATSSSKIQAAKWYENTATVSTDPLGGPEEGDLDNNTDSAQMRVVPALQVDKKWVVNGQTYEDGEQPTEAGTATLTLDPKPAAVDAQDDPEFGETYLYTVDDLGEDITVGETLSGMDAEACDVVSSEVTNVNGDPVTESLAYDHELLATPLPNTVEITNTLNCVIPEKPTKTIDETTVDSDGNLPGDLPVGSYVKWNITAPIPEDGTFTQASVYDELDSRLEYVGAVLAIEPAGGGTRVPLAHNVDYTVDQTGTASVEWKFTPTGLTKLNANKGGDIQVAFVTQVEEVGDGVIENEPGTLRHGYGSSFNDKETPGDITPVTYWGEMVVQKVDESDPSVGLAEATFEVFDNYDAQNEECPALPSSGAIAEGTSGSDGAVKWDDVTPTNPLGLWIANADEAETDPEKVYCVYETAAPAGYQLDPDGQAVTITAGGVSEAEWVKITNVQRTGPSLPITGGVGTLLFVVIGGVLIGIASIMAARSRRRSTDVIAP